MEIELTTSLRDVEARYLREQLVAHDYDLTAAATAAGVSEDEMMLLIKRHGLSMPLAAEFDLEAGWGVYGYQTLRAQACAAFERRFLSRVLLLKARSLRVAAQAAKINRKTLVRLLERHGVSWGRGR